MSHRVLPSLGALVAVIAVVSLAPVPAAAQAQTAAADAATPPRTPDGRPDLQGIWSFATITPLERPDELAGQAFLTDEDAAAIEERQAQRRLLDPLPRPGVGGGGGAYNQAWYDPGTKVVETKRTSLIVDPPDGRLPPLTPETQQRAASAEAQRLADARRGRVPAVSWEDLRPGDRCIQHAKAGPPIDPGAYNNNIQLLQTLGYVAILNEQIHDTRIVPLDGRPHLAQQIRQWMGDSRGRWEGQTLVIETTNFNGKHAQVGRPVLSSGEQLSLIERFTRVDAETLLYEYTVTDPVTWVKPWSVQLPMKKNQDLMYEYACHEGNYSMSVRLSGARAMEKAAAEAAKTGSR